jgi:hypothetical protein
MQMHDTLHQAIVHLDKNEPSRVILLLDYVETRNTRLLHAVAGVLRACLFKSLDHVGLDVYMDMNNQHFRPPILSFSRAVSAGPLIFNGCV